MPPDADLEPDTHTAILDDIPGALDRAIQGLAEARAGLWISLEDL